MFRVLAVSSGAAAPCCGGCWLFPISGACVGYLMPYGLVFVALARDDNGPSVNCPIDHLKSYRFIRFEA